MKKTMYLSVGTAKPDGDNSLFTPDKAHPLLVFALGATLGEAAVLSREHLESTGWQDVLLDKTNPVDVDAIKAAQPEVQAAYEKALKEGSHGMALHTIKGSQ